MKKMRKLVPAFAMLMVAAIMLSTASFAWFTMNDEVTASGMEIQAKSTGSLIIGTAPLTSSNTKTNADLTPGTVELLRPITYSDGWKTFNGKVDPFTGIVTPPEGQTSALKTETVDIEDNEYFVDTQVYIGSAGDALQAQQLTINLSAISGADELASKAYAVAIYVFNPGENGWADSVYPTAGAEPDAIIHVDSVLDRSVIVLKNETLGEDGSVTYPGYTIPSIVGITGTDATGADNTTGLKVVLRFFVDGDLDAKDAQNNFLTKNKEIIQYIPNGQSYTPIDSETEVTVSTIYDEDTTYYDANGTVMNVNNLSEAQLAGEENLPETWCVRVVQYTPVQYKYVNSSAVPTIGTALSVSFTAAKISGN